MAAEAQRPPAGILCAICLWPIALCSGRGCEPNTLIPLSQLEALCARHGYVPRGREALLEWLTRNLPTKAHA